MLSQSTKERKAKLKCETPKKKFDGCCHVEMPNEDSKIHRKVTKSSIHNLFRPRMFTRKNES